MSDSMSSCMVKTRIGHPTSYFSSISLTEEYTELQLQAASVSADNDMHEKYLCQFQVELYDVEVCSMTVV